MTTILTRLKFTHLCHGISFWRSGMSNENEYSLFKAQIPQQWTIKKRHRNNSFDQIISKLQKNHIANPCETSSICCTIFNKITRAHCEFQKSYPTILWSNLKVQLEESKFVKEVAAFQRHAITPNGIKLNLDTAKSEKKNSYTLRSIAQNIKNFITSIHEKCRDM